MVSETLRVRGHGGVDLAVHHLGGDGPPVLLAHATGFHGRCWVPLARALTDQYTVWAIDQRGHGASGKSPGDRYDDWDAFAADLLAAVDAIGGDHWCAGGHSLGGGVALLAEARRPGTFHAIACYEPVAIPPGLISGAEGDPAAGPGPAAPPGASATADPGSAAPPPPAADAAPAAPPGAGEGLRPRPGGNPLAQLARKRRAVFESRQAAYENYRSKAPFARFDPAALRCYVEFGLVDQPDGKVTLACRREDEAAVFEGALGNPAWSELPNVRAPVAIMAGGDLNDPVARAAEMVARRIPRGGLVEFPDLDHFGPMTAPGAVGAAMAKAFAEGASPKAVAPPR
jgi:pimeloyl-ACP methyl ester carboxylesterase